MVSNSHSIISFSDFGFDQLLTLCDVEDPTFVFSNVRNQAPQKDQSKGIKNPVGQVENVVEVQDTGNSKNKALENSIDNKHAFIDITVAPKNDFVDKATKIFTE